VIQFVQLLNLSAILDWLTLEQAVQSCYRNIASCLFQHQLALVVSESIAEMRPSTKSHWHAGPTSSHYSYGRQATWMCRLA